MRLAWRLGVLSGIFAVDRLTKLWAVSWLMPRGTYPLLPFFDLSYVENTGAAFGIGFSRNAFFTGLSIVLLSVIFYLQRRWAGRSAWIQAGLVLVAGGAIGNLYDRLTLGYVVDFLHIYYWPVFNVADSCVTVGALCLAWGLRAEELRAEKSA